MIWSVVSNTLILYAHLLLPLIVLALLPLPSKTQIQPKTHFFDKLKCFTGKRERACFTGLFHETDGYSPTALEIKNMESPTTVTTQNEIDSINGDPTENVLSQNSKKSSGNRYSLSPEQEIHFKDSKVRDENGKLTAPIKDGDIRYSLSGGLEKNGKILYNDNNPLAVVNRAKSNNKEVYLQC